MNIHIYGCPEPYLSTYMRWLGSTSWLRAPSLALERSTEHDYAWTCSRLRSTETDTACEEQITAHEKSVIEFGVTKRALVFFLVFVHVICAYLPSGCYCCWYFCGNFFSLPPSYSTSGHCARWWSCHVPNLNRFNLPLSHVFGRRSNIPQNAMHAIKSIDFGCNQ